MNLMDINQRTRSNTVLEVNEPCNMALEPEKAFAIFFYEFAKTENFGKKNKKLGSGRGRFEETYKKQNSFLICN
ncbi:hypothetical protein PAHAL_3G454500 [Panicum hallii]|uniref:Uncharacterized protein n=1 Tax=Panicum hallii TaxID=206008 RepID=A0A2T8KLE8_9POAL|nr:hypothetical protein PAHAL_3G454500 [Panicum hallii]